MFRYKDVWQSHSSVCHVVTSNLVLDVCGRATTSRVLTKQAIARASFATQSAPILAPMRARTIATPANTSRMGPTAKKSALIPNIRWGFAETKSCYVPTLRDYGGGRPTGTTLTVSFSRFHNFHSILVLYFRILWPMSARIATRTVERWSTILIAMDRSILLGLEAATPVTASSWMKMIPSPTVSSLANWNVLAPRMVSLGLSSGWAPTFYTSAELINLFSFLKVLTPDTIH